MLVALAGAATLVAEVMSVTLLQRAVPDEQAARVFGVYDQLNVGAIALGSVLAGPLADQLGPDTALVVVAGCSLVAAMLATSRLQPGTARRSPGRHPAPAARHAAPVPEF